jgi:hypothetical protein
MGVLSAKGIAPNLYQTSAVVVLVRRHVVVRRARLMRKVAVDRHFLVGRRESARGRVLSRRNIFKRAVGVAAAGAAGAVLTEAVASPARAATTVEQGALSPAVVALTDAPTIAVDASTGNDFRVTLGASRTMGTPSNPANGQQIIFQITQGSTGSAALTWAAGYEFTTGLPAPTLSTAPGQTDLLGFIYNAVKGTWLLAAFVYGFD